MSCLSFLLWAEHTKPLNLRALILKLVLGRQCAASSFFIPAPKPYALILLIFVLLALGVPSRQPGTTDASSAALGAAC